MLVFARDGGRSCKPGVYVAQGDSAPRRILSSTDVEEVELDGGTVVGERIRRQATRVGSVQAAGERRKPVLITRGGGNPDRSPPGLHAEELVVEDGVAWWTRGEDNEFTTNWALRRTPVAGGTCDEVYFEDEEITALALVGGAPVIALGDELRRPDPASVTTRATARAYGFFFGSTTIVRPSSAGRSSRPARPRRPRARRLQLDPARRLAAASRSRERRDALRSRGGSAAASGRARSSVSFSDDSAASRNATDSTMPRSNRLTRPSSGSPAAVLARARASGHVESLMGRSFE